MKVSKLDLFPQITAETKKRKLQRKAAKAHQKKNGGPKLAKDPIIACPPTNDEIASARLIVKDRSQFRLFDHGHVCIFDKKLTKEKKKQIIADITFTDLNTISAQKRENLDFLLKFLETSKKFVNHVGSKGRSCGGYMWAIGWRKSMTRLEIVGRYANREAIKKNQAEFRKHIHDSFKASEILWELFFKIGNVALEANHQFMTEHHLPCFAAPELQTQTEASSLPNSKKSFSTNLTFTSNGFFNHPHKDDRDDERLPFAFLLSLPSFKSEGKLAFDSDGYDVKEGQFVFPQCGFGIDFKPNTMVQMIFSPRLYQHGTLKPEETGNFTRVGMSLQIARKITNILDRVLAEEFVNTKEVHHVGDVPYILKKVKK
jgi:hypothetical protein